MKKLLPHFYSMIMIFLVEQLLREGRHPEWDFVTLPRAPVNLNPVGQQEEGTRVWTLPAYLEPVLSSYDQMASERREANWHRRAVAAAIRKQVLVHGMGNRVIEDRRSFNEELCREAMAMRAHWMLDLLALRRIGCPTRMKPCSTIAGEYYQFYCQQNEPDWADEDWLPDIWTLLRSFEDSTHDDLLNLTRGIVDELPVPGVIFDMSELSSLQAQADRIIRETANDNSLMARWFISILPHESRWSWERDYQLGTL